MQVVFTGRCLWNVFYFLNINPLQDSMSDWLQSGNDAAYFSGYFVFYLVFEVMPTAVVLYICSFVLPVRGGGDDASATPTTPLLHGRSRPLSGASDAPISNGKAYLLSGLPGASDVSYA